MSAEDEAFHSHCNVLVSKWSCKNIHILIAVIDSVSSIAPGVADLASAGNWAEEYLAAEAVAQSKGGEWMTEFMETRAPSRAQLAPSHTPTQWAHEYLEQNEHKVW